MKKNDIKAGVLYGFAEGTSDYTTAQPVIVLDAKGLWTWYRGTRSDKTEYRVSSNTRYQAASGGWSSYWGPHGYLVLSGTNWQDADKQAAHLDQMRTLAEEFSKTPGNPDAVHELAAKLRKVEHISLRIVNNRWITGDYEEAKNAETVREERRQAERKAERDRSAAQAEFLAELTEIMSTKLERKVFLQTDHNYGGALRVSISFDALADYFGIKSPTDRL